VRYGDWKLNLLGKFSEKEQQNIQKSTYKSTQFSAHAELYDLRSDPGETTDIADKHPEIVDKILKLAEQQKSLLGEYTEKGPEVRKTIVIESPTTIIK